MAARIWLVYKIIGGAGVSSARIGAHTRAHMCAYARIPEIKKTDFAKPLRFSRKTIPGGPLWDSCAHRSAHTYFAHGAVRAAPWASGAYLSIPPQALDTYVKFIVRKLLEEKQASNMRWCLYTSIWAHM